VPWQPSPAIPQEFSNTGRMSFMKLTVAAEPDEPVPEPVDPVDPEVPEPEPEPVDPVELPDSPEPPVGPDPPEQAAVPKATMAKQTAVKRMAPTLA
jgi:hypothetical protein